MNPGFGKSLILIGAVFMVFGVLLSLKDRIPWLGKLPGDIWVKNENFSFYFPLTTCVLLSIILSLIFYLFRRS